MKAFMNTKRLKSGPLDFSNGGFRQLKRIRVARRI